MNPTFVGVDLAWAPRNPSGLAALSPGPRGLEVRALETRVSDEDVADFVRGHLGPLTVVMVDAPLVVPNRDGMRECDRLTHVHFGRQHAGCYPANRGNMGRYTGGPPRGERLGRRLARLGFHWPPGSLPGRPPRSGHFLFECYPHPAQVRLFGLGSTLKYKKKRQPWAAARKEFRRYLELVRGLRRPRLVLRKPTLRLLDVAGLVGRRYKEREDKLDALFCAYLAALMPERRLEMLGRPERGSIVVPYGASRRTRQARARRS